MRKLFVSLGIAVFALASCAEAYGQAADSSHGQGEPSKAGVQSAVGEVISTEPTKNRILIKTDAGNKINILLDERTACVQASPGDRDMAKAVKIAASNIKSGDRVYARGETVDSQGSLLARQVILMAKDEVSKKQQQDRDQWRQRGIAGVVKAVNPEAKEIVVQM